MTEQDETGLLREIHALLGEEAPPEAPAETTVPQKEIDWSEYEFHFDDETPPAAAPVSEDTLPPGEYSLEYMRRLHQSAGDGAGQPREPLQPAQTVKPVPPREPPLIVQPIQPPVSGEQPPADRRELPRATAKTANQPKRKPSAPAPASEEGKGEQQMNTPRKKHRILKIILWAIGILLALLLLTVAAAELFGKPVGAQSLGARKNGCATILLVGTDAAQTRTDTIMLLHVDRPGKALRLLSIPRDTKVNGHYDVPKINGAYGVNGGGEEGMDALMGYVSDLIGYRPDGYMLIHLDCFVELVDKMGGVDFDVPADMYYDDPWQELHIDLKAGQQHLNGEQAMQLVRFRNYGDDYIPDFMRTKVQREFIGAALAQWKKFPTVLRAPGALRLLLHNTDTDLNFLNLLWLADSAVLCGTGNMQSDRLPCTIGSTYVYEDVEEAAALINEKYNPYEADITADALRPGT